MGLPLDCHGVQWAYIISNNGSLFTNGSVRGTECFFIWVNMVKPLNQPGYVDMVGGCGGYNRGYNEI